MQERGVFVDHATAIKILPVLAELSGPARAD